ncbi:hypothetical protein SANA_13970 [Gottschalkiaceae bacterium SANA]|nr:hypothetical protein SANA_13970 [Gottschalkiaceae bacterium SANA]
MGKYWIKWFALAAIVLLGLDLLTGNPILAGIASWLVLSAGYFGKKDDGRRKNRLFLVLITLIVMICLNMATGNILLSGVTTWIIIIVGYLAWSLYRQKKRLSLLEVDCDPNAFIVATESQMCITGKNPKFRAFLQIDLAAGLILEGEFQEAKEELLSVNVERLSDKNGSKLVYVLNLISCHFELGELDQAEQLFETQMPLLTTYNRRMQVAVKAQMAERLFFLERYEESRSAFHALLQEKISARVRVSILYRLAQMDDQMGDWSLAEKNYRLTVEQGNRLWIAEQAKHRLAIKELENEN